MEKGREFWIDLEPDGDDGEILVYQALSKHPRQGPLQWQASLVHVIEKSYADKLEAELAEMTRKYKSAINLIKEFDPEDCFVFEDGSEDLAQEVMDFLKENK